MATIIYGDYNANDDRNVWKTGMQFTIMNDIIVTGDLTIEKGVTIAISENKKITFQSSNITFNGSESNNITINGVNSSIVFGL